MSVPEGLMEKSPLQSKKFVAYLVAEITWKVALVTLLVLGIKEAKIDLFIGSISLGIVIIAGAIEALYIGGQAGLDKYTRIAQIAASAGQSFTMKGVETKNGHTTSPSKPLPKRADLITDLNPVAPEDEEGG